MTTAAPPRLVQAILDRAGMTDEASPFVSEGGRLFSFHTAMEITRGFNGERPVVWMNVFFPYELLYALDLIPLSFEVMGGLTGSLGLTDALDRADDAYPSRDTCTFLRSGLGGGLERLFPPPAALLCTSHLCEGAPKVAHALSRETGAPYLLLDVPDRVSPAAEAYVAAQLERITQELEPVAGADLNLDRLAEAFQHSNDAAAAMCGFNELRKHSPAPMFGSPTTGMRLYLPWGHPVGAQITSLLLQEARQRVEANTPVLDGGEAYRLLWLHLRPYYETDLFELVEVERRAVIVYNNFCDAYWEPLDIRDPFRSLARKILSNPDLRPAAAAAEYYVEKAQAYGVDGAVQFSHWGCRWNAGRNRILKDAFAEIDVPFINIDGDGVDCRAASAGQLRTRLEGFLEILESRDDI